MGLLAGKTLAARAVPRDGATLGTTDLDITPPLALGDNPAGQTIQIDDELMTVVGGKRNIISVAREVDSTHEIGAAITELNPFVASEEGGGGAIAVTGGGVTVSDVTEIDLGGALVTDEGGGVAAVPQPILNRTVTLTHAQIITLPSTPVELIPAAGAGKIIHLIGISLVADVDAGVYTNMDDDTMVYGVLDPASVFSAASIPVAGSSLLGDVANRTSFLLSNFGVDPVAAIIVKATPHSAAAAINTPIALGCDNPNGAPGVDLTGGNAANTLKATALYVVLDA